MGRGEGVGDSVSDQAVSDQSQDRRCLHLDPQLHLPLPLHQQQELGQDLNPNRERHCPQRTKVSCRIRVDAATAAEQQDRTTGRQDSSMNTTSWQRGQGRNGAAVATRCGCGTECSGRNRKIASGGSADADADAVVVVVVVAAAAVAAALRGD